MYYGFIYITTNLMNGKKYIGQKTLYSKSGELRNDINGYLGSGILLKKAINKYGEENFRREIIYLAKDKEELGLMERNFIKYHNACQSDDYYNIHEGGYGGNTMCGFSEQEMEEHKQNIKSRYEDAEYKLMFKESINQSWSDERRKKASESTKLAYVNNPELKKIRTNDNVESWKNPDIRNNRIRGMSKNPIIQLDLNGIYVNEFLNSNIAAKYMGAKDGSAIRSCCRGDKKFYKGFIWIYKDEYEKMQSA